MASIFDLLKSQKTAISILENVSKVSNPYKAFALNGSSDLSKYFSSGQSHRSSSLSSFPESFYIENRKTISDSLKAISRLDKVSPILHVGSGLISAINIIKQVKLESYEWNRNEWIDEQIDEITEISNNISSEGFSSGQLEQLNVLIRNIVLTSEIKLHKSKSEKLWNAISVIIILLSFLKDTIDFVLKNSDLTNKQVIEELNSSYKTLHTEIDSLFTQIRYSEVDRYATKDCILYLKPSTNTQKLGTIRKNQYVSVIDKNHKWLYISYVDNFTNEPQSGWVIKKYFDLITN